jgi:antitoxin VapB
MQLHEFSDTPHEDALFHRPLNLFPIASFQEISLKELNACLVAWGHKMGELKRPRYGMDWNFCLFEQLRPVAVVSANRLISPHVGAGLSHLTRESTIELSRLCAERPHLCRVALRLWREFVFPRLGFDSVISYQDADLHNGNTYRFDGWHRSEDMSRSGTDSRSGVIGRRKWVWVWPNI